MTSGEVDRVLNVLTEFRVESAERFGRIDATLAGFATMPIDIVDLKKRVSKLEIDGARAGRFTWGDVLRVVAGLAAGGSLIALFVTLVLTLANHQ